MEELDTRIKFKSEYKYINDDDILYPMNNDVIKNIQTIYNNQNFNITHKRKYIEKLIEVCTSWFDEVKNKLDDNEDEDELIITDNTEKDITDLYISEEYFNTNFKLEILNDFILTKNLVNLSKLTIYKSYNNTDFIIQSILNNKYLYSLTDLNISHTSLNKKQVNDIIQYFKEIPYLVRNKLEYLEVFKVNTINLKFDLKNTKYSEELIKENNFEIIHTKDRSYYYQKIIHILNKKVYCHDTKLMHENITLLVQLKF
jgi:hypothetical protein